MQRYAPPSSPVYKDGMLTLAEVSLKTGRYHQIRRHLAWHERRPLVGDALYAGKLQAHHFRRRGLYLCSRGLVLQHPCYNSDDGRKEWERRRRENRQGWDEGLRLSNDGIVEVAVRLDLPGKFDKLLDGEEKWAEQHALQQRY